MAAKETFGITDKDKIMGGIDGMNPTNKSELNEFQEALNKKICQFKNLDDFPSFIEELVRGVCVNCNYLHHIRVSMHFNFTLYDFCLYL